MDARQAEDLAYFEEHWPPFAVLLRYLSGDAAISAEDARLNAAVMAGALRREDEQVGKTQHNLIRYEAAIAFVWRHTRDPAIERYLLAFDPTLEGLEGADE